MSKSYANLKKHAEKNGELELDAEIPVEVLEEYMAGALAEFAENFEMPGFRKGKVPEHIVRERVGDMDLLENSVDPAVRDAIREIVADEKIVALGRPEVVVKKLAPKNPLEFKIRFALIPDVKLPDYKAIGKNIAGRKDIPEITETELDEAVERLRKMMAFQPSKNGEAAPLPEINDTFVKQLGSFENVTAFRAELKKNLTQEKEMNAQEAKRDEMIKEIMKQAKLAVPPLLVDQELEAFADQRDAEIERAGITFEEYLKQAKKNKEELEKEERVQIEGQIKTSIVFAEIRKRENVAPNEKEVQLNLMQLKRRYPDRSETSLRESAEAAAVQKKLFEILEGIEDKNSS